MPRRNMAPWRHLIRETRCQDVGFFILQVLDINLDTCNGCRERFKHIKKKEIIFNLIVNRLISDRKVLTLNRNVFTNTTNLYKQ